MATLDGLRAQLSKPSLTAINDQPAETAELAVKMLLQLIENPLAAPQREILQARLVIREST
ncbi:DNA-binding LacI/PurR family transcriptional regulator [Mesorhizobium soli]|nr:DNA-binding LacI/PurR family transcriptional regulator [Mesorhizobium soli]